MKGFLYRSPSRWEGGHSKQKQNLACI